MKVIETSLKDVLILEPKVFGDERGFFFESWNQNTFKEVAGVNERFVQDNHSKSQKGVLRGLHYQLEQSQGKLVRTVTGVVLDVVLIFVKAQQHLESILRLSYRQRVIINSGFLQGLRMALLSSVSQQIFYIRRQTIMRHSMKSVFVGMIRIWVSIGN